MIRGKMKDFGHFEKGKYIPSVLEECLAQHDAAVDSDRFKITCLDRVKFEVLIEETARRIVELKAEGQIVGLTRIWGTAMMHIDIQVRLQGRQVWKLDRIDPELGVVLK